MRKFNSLLFAAILLLFLLTCSRDPLNPYDPKAVEEGFVTPAPVFEISEGQFHKDIQVEISCSEEVASIYYTIDGSDPTINSNLYISPVPIAGDESIILLKAVSKNPDKNLSGISVSSYSIDYLELELSASGNGSVSPSGIHKVAQDSSFIATAIADSGYAFSYWTVAEGEGIEIEDIYSLDGSITPTQTNGKVQANFETGIDFTINNDGHGTTDPADTITVVQDIPRTISAVPDFGYVFSEWTHVSGGTVNFDNSTSAVTKATLTAGAAVIRADFELATYELTVSAATGGTVTPAAPAIVNHGAAEAITATPSGGYMFDGWSIISGSGVTIADDEDPTTNVTLIGGDAEIRADFRILRTLTMTNDGNGTTSPVSGNYQVGDELSQVITATPSSGYGFSHWSVSGSALAADVNSASTTVTLSGGNGTVTANFTDNTYSLTVNSGGNGTTNPSGTSTIVHGVATAISATPTTAGYEFVSWSVPNGSASFGNSSAASTTVTLTSGAATIQANFALETYALTMTDNGFGSTSASTTVTYGVAHSITATPDTGYDFDSWSVTSGTASIANTGSSSTTVTLTSGAATLQAIFTPKDYTLQIDNDGNGSTTPTGTQTVSHAAATAISATADANYVFSNWSVESGTADIVNSNAASTTVTLTSGAATIQANFLPTYTLTVSNDGNGSNSPIGTVTVTHGESTSIEATPNTNYDFSSWSVESGTASFGNSSAASTTVILTSGSATIQANFALETYALTMTDNGFGSTSPSTTVTYGVAHSITATPDTGYDFYSWSVPSGTASITDTGSASTTVTLINGAATIQANFIPSIGTFYEGGIVFYHDGTGGGLIVAESDQGISNVWGGYGTDINGDNSTVAPELTAVGTGAANTAIIVSTFGATEPYGGLSNYAAKICDDLELNGYTDWFLPSKDELNLMYEQKGAIGSFIDANYHSSSEVVSNAAWIQFFFDGTQQTGGKQYEHRVRAVRAFTN